MSTATARLLPLVMLLAPALAVAAGGKIQTVTDPALPRALSIDGPVSVSWEDPAGFSEIRFSGNPHQARQGTWVVDLANYLARQSSAALAPGQHLSLSLTDIDLAGDFEPWKGPQWQDVRVMRDIHSPRIRLSYTLRNAGGEVIQEGDSVLSDLSYLHNVGRLQRQGQPLIHEKRMIDRWVHHTLQPTAVSLAGL